METNSWIEIYTPEKGLVLREPAVIAFVEKNRIVAIGRDAQEKTLLNASVVNPFYNGQIKMTKEDFDAATKILAWFVQQTYKKCCRKRLFHKFKIAFCMTPGATNEEKKVMEDALYRIGAKKVILMEQTVEEVMKDATIKDWELLLVIKDESF